MIERVISGGQAGADRGGLDGAMRVWGNCDRIGGWCPSGRRAEDGPIPAKYPLQEIEQWDYPSRTRLNVQNSDGTVVFTNGAPNAGSRLTLDLAQQSRAFLHIDLSFMSKQDAVDLIADWADATQIKVLNVAGSRESSHPGIQEWVADVIEGVLREVGVKP